MIQWFLDGGNAMWVLLALSILSWAFIIERFFVLQAESKAIVILKKKLDAGRLTFKDISKAVDGHPCTLSRVLTSICENIILKREDSILVTKSTMNQEMNQLRRGLTVLEISAGISPLIGLLGTVLGMVTIFAAIGKSGLGDPMMLSSGISTALNTTVFGLVTAIPCSAAYSFYEHKVETIMRAIEKYATLTLSSHYSSNGYP
jgi:biopolymer transport protein ExbB